MYHGRQSGGPKQKKWIENAAVAFRGFFGKRSGSPLPAAPPDAPLSEADHAASSSDEELPPPSPRVLSPTPVAWDANGRPTLRVCIEPRSPVPISGDEELHEALLYEPLLSREDVCDDSPPSSPQPAASTPLEPMPPSAPEETSGQTPLERKISDTRKLITLLVQTRAQGVTSQARLAGCINWTSRYLSNFMTGNAPKQGKMFDRTALGNRAHNLLADLGRHGFMTKLPAEQEPAPENPLAPEPAPPPQTQPPLPQPPLSSQGKSTASQPPSPLTGTPIITVNLAEVEAVHAGGTVHVLSLGDRVRLAPNPRSLTLSLILTLNLALRLNLTRTLTLTLEPSPSPSPSP